MDSPPRTDRAPIPGPAADPAPAAPPRRSTWTPASGDVLVRLAARKAARLRFLHALYEMAEGSTNAMVPVEAIAERARLPMEQAWAVKMYLHAEDLLRGVTPVHVSLTHAGLEAVEEALVAPARPTEHVSAAENVIVIGTAEGAVIQQGTVDSVQRVELGAAELADARRRAAELDERIRALALEGEELAQLVAETATAKAQLGAARPRLAAVRETLGAVRELLETAVASGKAAAGLAAALSAATGLLALLR